MKYHKPNVKHSAAFLMAALLACQPVSAYAVTFSDLNQVPWAGAEVSIQKAADLGLMVGETSNGQTIFRPRDSVSLCETAQLAYKLMTNTGKLTASASTVEKWTTVMQTYNIPSWAYTAIANCLEKGIISISELGGYMKNGSTLPATREQAAEILGRALTVSVSSYTASSTSTTFADNSSISSSAIPYVAVLKQAGVINGDDANNFYPKSTLNRSETAVMVTNLYSVLANSTSAATTTTTVATSSTSGTIAGLTNFYVNFENSNSYYLFSTTGSTTSTLNGQSTTIANLVTLFKNGLKMTAQVSLDSSNHVTKIEVTADTSTKEEEVTGTIKSLSKTSIKIGTKTYSIENSSKVTVKIDGSTEDFSELKDLFDDDETITATLTLDKDGYVTKIVATTKSSSSTKKGELKGVYDTDGKDYEGYIKVDSTKYYIEDLDDIDITIDNKTKDFDDLMDAYKKLDDDEYYQVTVTLDKNDKTFITKINAVLKDADDDDDDEENGTKKGTIKSLSTTKIKIGSTSYTLKSTSSLDIDIEDGHGNTIDEWDDFKAAYDDGKEMSVTITIKSGKVTKVKGEVVKVKGTLYKCDEDEIKVKTDSGKYTYDFDDDPDDIDVTLVGNKSVDNLEDLLEVIEDDDDDMIVTLTLKDGYVTEIAAEWD